MNTFALGNYLELTAIITALVKMLIMLVMLCLDMHCLDMSAWFDDPARPAGLSAAWLMNDQSWFNDTRNWWLRWAHIFLHFWNLSSALLQVQWKYFQRRKWPRARLHWMTIFERLLLSIVGRVSDYSERISVTCRCMIFLPQLLRSFAKLLDLIAILLLKPLQSLFLDASTHLYKRVCPSVGPSVGPSVRPLVRRWVRPSVRP